MSVAGETVDTGMAVAPAAGELREISQWSHVWKSIRRDRAAVAGIVYIAALLVAAFIGAPLVSRAVGHGPAHIYPLAVDQLTAFPVGPWTHVDAAPYAGAEGTFDDTLFILGGDRLGRDLLLRLLYGARTSLEVALLTSLLSIAIGGALGLAAGYFRGFLDTVVSHLIAISMVLPALIFFITIRGIYYESLNEITLGVFPNGVVMLVLLLTLVTWFYPARVVRGVVVSLREKEFIEAARMTGAGDFRIMRAHLLPHLVAPVVVLFTIAVATTIITESGLTYLGLGIEPPTASWGNLMSDAVGLYLHRPLLMIWPGLFVLFTTLAFNLVGDAFREAFDPHGLRSGAASPGVR